MMMRMMERRGGKSRNRKGVGLNRKGLIRRRTRVWGGGGSVKCQGGWGGGDEGLMRATEVVLGCCKRPYKSFEESKRDALY